MNDDFFKDLGLEEMPQSQRKPFFDHIYSELESRVGERLSQGMSEELLEEFARIVEKDVETIDNFINKHAPNYTEEPMFQRLVQVTGVSPDDPRLKGEYAATKWLAVNRPDYRDVVNAVMAELKKEIVANRQAILSGIVAQQQDDAAAAASDDDDADDAAQPAAA
ncbi:hypothetical protein CR969_02155 [Candidatus Saccharibacteria bacterium]|nr:MAG: hypothetical protein CR969_02155 [Candidatus Saccharibacteria bacterium]